MRLIFEDNVLRVVGETLPGSRSGGGVVLSFTGIGHAMGGLDVQKPEFFGAGRGFDEVVFVTDKTRSWGNRLDFGRLAALLDPIVAGRRLCTVGNSMGGFLAVVATRHLPVTRAVAFVPQFSVDPRVVPWEPRWRDYRDAIEYFAIPDLGEAFAVEPTYFVFSGGTNLDRRQARHFPVADNIHHLLFPEVDHGLAGWLKAEGRLADILAACLWGPVDPTALATLCPGPVERLSPA